MYFFLVSHDFSGGRRIQGMVRMLWVNIRMRIVALSDGVCLIIIGQVYQGDIEGWVLFMLLWMLKLYTTHASGYKQPNAV